VTPRPRPPLSAPSLPSLYTRHSESSSLPSIRPSIRHKIQDGLSSLKSCALAVFRTVYFSLVALQIASISHVQKYISVAVHRRTTLSKVSHSSLARGGQMQPDHWQGTEKAQSRVEPCSGESLVCLRFRCENLLMGCEELVGCSAFSPRNRS
jgi:hypothetical protein